MGSLAPRKRIFVALLAGSLGVLAALGAGIWFLAKHRMYTYQRTVLTLAAMLGLALFLVALLGVFGLILVLWMGRMFPFANNIVSVAINFLFPVALQVGKTLGLNEERIKSSFIEVNNQLVMMKKIRANSEEVLVLAPHCLQSNGCPHKITRDIRNCKQCGGCQIQELLNINNQYRVNVAVVTGGTLARKHIQEYRPRAVVAIACERDLTSGILDSYPLPVLGILNERPNGPCTDTRVEMESVRSAIKKFTERG